MKYLGIIYKMNVIKRHKFYLLLDKGLSLILGISYFIVFFVLVQIFCFSTFKIPSDSMEPELLPGDQVIVNKMSHGARLFNLLAAMKGEPVKVYRLPSMGKIQRNEVLVFHFPHPHTWDKLEMHLLKYYIKRCIGLPGDTLWVENGMYKVRGSDEVLGNVTAQQQMSWQKTKNMQPEIYWTFPYDSIINWNIQNFGPLYIPKKGDTLLLNRTNYLLYGQLIEWEQQTKLYYQNTVTYMNNSPLFEYQFQHNYYFMAGDRCENSQDSRYWGLLPDDFIVGKAWLIGWSIDIYTGRIRWNRYLKRIS